MVMSLALLSYSPPSPSIEAGWGFSEPHFFDHSSTTSLSMSFVTQPSTRQAPLRHAGHWSTGPNIGRAPAAENTHGDQVLRAAVHRGQSHTM